MADRYFGVEFGDEVPSLVLEGASSTAAKDVEVRITYDASNASKTNVLKALEVISMAITQDTFPPV